MDRESIIIEQSKLEFYNHDIFEQWIRKLINREYTVPSTDDNIEENNGQKWVSSQGRNGSKDSWICEVAATTIYSTFRIDTCTKLRDNYIKQGLIKRGFLHPVSKNHDIYRRVWCKDSENNLVLKRRVYLILLNCLEYTELLKIKKGKNNQETAEDNSYLKKGYQRISGHKRKAFEMSGFVLANK